MRQPDPDQDPIRSRPDEEPELDLPAPPRTEHADAPAPARAPAKRRRPLVWLLVLALIAGPAGWWFWSKRDAGGGPKAPAAVARIPVDAATVAVADVPVFLNGLGTVQAFNTVTIRSRVDGELIEVAFQEGQTVQQGDLLARIDPRPYQAALEQAQAKKLQDEATLASTKLDLERTRLLAVRSFASQQQLDQQTAQVAAQNALIKADAAQVDNARTQLDYTTIRAPLTGRLGLRLVDRGNIVHASDTSGLVEIAQLQPISVIFTAPEGQLPQIQDAMRDGSVRVIALQPDGKTPIDEGTLSLINNAVDAASGTVRLKGVFPNPQNRLWPGLSVNTRLLVRTLRDAVTVPADAVQRGPGGLYAYAIGEGDKAEKRNVQVGPILDDVAVILEGLRPGDKVVTAGQSRVQPGSVLQATMKDAPAGRSQEAEASPTGGNKTTVR